MRLSLDTGQMRDCLSLWRYSLGHRADTTVARTLERAQALEKINASILRWLDLLRLCTPQDEVDRRELQEVTAEISEFKIWADEARMAFKILIPPEACDG